VTDIDQGEIWKRMLDLIRRYEAGSVGFYRMVGDLEGLLDAAEFKDSSLVKQWYDFWAPLEVLRAMKGTSVTPRDSAGPLGRMKQFLLEKWR
jgi:hypothetical protein